MSSPSASRSEKSTKSLGDKRIRRGECPTCGTRTHKIGFFGKRTALTIEGVCLYGRCLFCNPVMLSCHRVEISLHTQKRPAPAKPVVQPQSIVPTTISTDDRSHDDGTLVSGITMDQRLVVDARNWSGRMVDEDEGTIGIFRNRAEFLAGVEASANEAPNSEKPIPRNGSDDNAKGAMRKDGGEAVKEAPDAMDSRILLQPEPKNIQDDQTEDYDGSVLDIYQDNPVDKDDPVDEDIGSVLDIYGDNGITPTPIPDEPREPLYPSRPRQKDAPQPSLRLPSHLRDRHRTGSRKHSHKQWMQPTVGQLHESTPTGETPVDSESKAKEEETQLESDSDDEYVIEVYAPKQPSA